MMHFGNSRFDLHPYQRLLAIAAGEETQQGLEPGLRFQHYATCHLDGLPTTSHPICTGCGIMTGPLHVVKLLNVAGLCESCE